MSWSEEEKRRFTGIEDVLSRIDISLHGDDTDNDDQGLVGRVRDNSLYRVRLQKIHSTTLKFTIGLIPVSITAYIAYFKIKYFGGNQ